MGWDAFRVIRELEQDLFNLVYVISLRGSLVWLLLQTRGGGICVEFICCRFGHQMKCTFVH